MSFILDEHRQYLADEARTRAFHRAIGEVVKPGDVVVDLGAGTGILGLLACRAGAKRVYSVEETAIIDLTRDLCRANGYEDRVTLIKESSTRAELPERADVVVADQIGEFGFDAGIFEYFRDARERFLKPDGVTIPSRIDLHVAPVEFRQMWERVEFWNTSPEGFDFSPVRARAVNACYSVKLRPEQLLGEPATLASLDPSRAPATWLRLEASCPVRRAGTLHGIGGWFFALLSPNVTLSNSPLAEAPINRRAVFFPIASPVAVEEGDRVRITMSIVPAETLMTWKVDVWGSAVQDRPKATFTHSTFQGMLLCKEDLQRTRPEFVPILTPWGEARRSILELCDGKTPLAEIEKEVHRRHQALFRSPAEAAQFVAEVVTRYAR
ncbi:MAG: 50S ribosomal protein L11 methyltransferase [Nitrospirota bacterium]